MQKKLIILIIILIPITIISFFSKETNFIMPKQNEKQSSIKIPIKTSNDVFTLELEDYIIGVVAGEMPALFEDEALKAQAIASRTYAINYLENNKYLTDTTSTQVYLTKEDMQQKWQSKFQEYYNKIKNAVLSTKNQIMYYNDKPIKAYYYAMSNGYTESSLNVFNEQEEYLNIIPSPYDEDNEYTINITKEEFCAKLSINCNDINISSIIKDQSNRIKTISINGKNFSGIEIRSKLSLRSTDFTFNINNDNIQITTKGYGHGVGMSQYGANNMAKEGYTYEEILKYYYQNIEIDEI